MDCASHSSDGDVVTSTNDGCLFWHSRRPFWSFAEIIITQFQGSYKLIKFITLFRVQSYLLSTSAELANGFGKILVSFLYQFIRDINVAS